MEQIEDGKENHDGRFFAAKKSGLSARQSKIWSNSWDVFDILLAGKTVQASNFSWQRICHRLHQTAQRSRQHSSGSNGVNEFQFGVE